jgi:hypothetical protein
MSGARVVLHVGVSKTGTSTLQEEVFPAHPGIDYRSWPGEGAIPLLYDCLYADTIYDDDERFSRCAEAIGESHRGATRPILYSREHLTHQRYDKGAMASRLRRLFGEARIVITIRNQLDWIESSHVWNQQLLRRPWQGGLPPSMESWLAGQWKERWRSRLSSGDFGAIVRRYVELFGADDVCVLPFEELVAQPDLFADRLFGFLGVDRDRGRALLEGKHRNPRLARREYELWRWRAWLMPLAVQRVLAGIALPSAASAALRAGPRYRARVPESWRERLSAHYAPGNRYIMATCALPLDRYGYPV